jgi:hypothetical protein
MRLGILGTCLVAAGIAAGVGERTERFDKDPGWDGRNNRSTAFEPRPVRQDFGYSPETQHAGGRAPGEIGGTITPAAEPAYYARPIPEASFDDKLSASGVLAYGEGPVHVLIGFFNASTLNEWRTPNTIALRIQGRGEMFYAYAEYGTGRWRAGADNPHPFAERDPRAGRAAMKEFAGRGAVHHWSLTYDPEGNGGLGVVTATIDGETNVCHLAPGHKADGATFNRFGVLTVMKSADTPGTLWIDDVTVNGQTGGFDADPGWEGLGNRRTYESANVRPRFDFGFSPTHFAGGAAPGELGGLTFRGDCREAARMAAYGDRIGPLSLDLPLRASGKIALRRGVSDSTTLLGFYHSEKSLAVNPSQDSGFPEGFLGIAVEGPSREGFFVYPAYRASGGRQGYANGDDRPHILPDGTSLDWTLEYDPAGADGRGRITLTAGGTTVHLDLNPGDRDAGATFDRFGLVTTWIDGNGQSIYFDDLTYTAE